MRWPSTGASRNARMGLRAAQRPTTFGDMIEHELPPCGCAEPGTANASICYCGVEDLLRIIRRRYSLVVMNAIQSRGSARYVDIAAALPGISSSTLAETLHALDAARLISRVLQSEDRPSVSYALTQSGAKLLRRLRQLLDEVDSS